MKETTLNNKSQTNLFSTFNFNERVKIKPLNIEGNVLSFWLRRVDCLDIEVRYFLNNTLKTDFFFEEELESVTKQSELMINSKEQVVEIEKEQHEKRGVLTQQVLEIFNKDLNIPHDTLEISNLLRKGAPNIRSALNRLKNDKIIKIVGYREIGHKPLVVLYQLKDSPLKEATMKSLEDGYTSITNFYSKYKGSCPSVSILAKLIIMHGLKMEPISYEKGLIKGYKESELKELCEEYTKGNVEINKSSYKVKKCYKKQEEAQNNTKLKKDSLENKILEYLKKNSSSKISSNELVERLNANPASLQNTIRLLKLDKKIKVVELEPENKASSIFIPLYQLSSSSFPSIEILENSKGHSTLRKFLQNYNNIQITYNEALKRVEDKKIKVTPLYIKGKVYKGYSVEDLLSCLSSYPASPLESTNSTNHLINNSDDFLSKITNFLKKKESKPEREFISF